jgi:hypothetical protein
MKRATALPLSLLLVLAGCSVAPPGLTVKPVAKDAQAQAPQTPGDAATSLSTPATANSQTTGTVNRTGGTSVNTSIDITAPGNTQATTATGVIIGTPNVISAAAGGHYLSADGLLSADVPPGALTKDAVIHISAVDTSAEKLTVGYVPGIRFNVDLGGARLTADQSIVVSTKVDSRFVNAMKARDAAFTPEKYNLRLDATGNWLMQMTVNGPTTKPVVRPAPANLSLRLIETGVLPLPGDVKAAASRSLMEVATPGGISSSADCQAWGDAIHQPVPANRSAWYSNEAAGQYSCNVYDGNGWYINIFHDVMASNPTCGNTASPDPKASVAPLATANIPTHTTWDSDDPAVLGKDAQGANVRFDLPWSPQNGPTDVVADAQGLAKSYTLAGLPVGLTANTEVGPAKGTTSQVTAADGMATVELKCPKFSPRVSFHVECASILPATLTLKYTLDGTEKTQVLMPAAGSKVADLQFYLIVPDDKDHEIKVTGADAGGDFGMTLPGPDAQKVHRNGIYTLSLRLQNIIAH